MNRKGQEAADIPFYIFMIFIVIGLFSAFALYINVDSKDRIEPSIDMKQFISYQGFLRSPDCFVYEDISGRTHSLTLDISKFNEKNLRSCYVTEKDDKNIPFRITLTYADKEIVLITKNWDNDKGVDKRESAKTVIVKGEREQIGKLILEMQNV